MNRLTHQYKTLGEASAAVLRDVGAGTKYAPAVAAMKQLAQSPIEVDLGRAMITSELINQGEPPVIVPRGAKIITGNVPLIIAPQYSLGMYRLDFALVAASSGRRLVVECDGYEYHDKVPERAAQDKQRDRYLLIQGWPMMRFTGIEIARTIDLCLADIAAYLFPKEGV